AETIQEVFQSASPGATTQDISRAVEEGMTKRGLHFLWVFTCAGNGMLRAPSKKVWEPGEVLHIDAGGAENGYLTDVCRMGARGNPSDLAKELFDACLSTLDTTRAGVRPGIATSELYDLGEKHFRGTGHSEHGFLTIHGIGMVSHEQPRFVPRNDRKLEAGMVLSIETDIRHPEVGYVKIEDTVAVTADGCEGLGDLGRERFAVVE
ncbi:MAG: M24 family metallopeptidase, partial [bacterium]